MFETKINARYLIKGRYVFWWLESLLPSFFRICAVILSVFPVMTAIYSPMEVFGQTDTRVVIALDFVLSFCSLFFLFFSYTRKLYLNAKLYFLLEENSTPPKKYYTVGKTCRYIFCRLIVMSGKLLNCLLFFSPFMIILPITVSGLFVSGGMIKSIFITLVFLSFCLFVTGALFSFTVNGRYFICDYLFYLNPDMPVISIVQTAKSLCRGKLIHIALCRIRLLPWKMLSVFPLSLPFSSVFIKACNAHISRELYTDRKFYIRLSRMLSAENDRDTEKYTHKNREADTGKLPRLFT